MPVERLIEAIDGKPNPRDGGILTDPCTTRAIDWARTRARGMAWIASCAGSIRR